MGLYSPISSLIKKIKEQEQAAKQPKTPAGSDVRDLGVEKLQDLSGGGGRTSEYETALSQALAALSQPSSFEQRMTQALTGVLDSPGISPEIMEAMYQRMKERIAEEADVLKEQTRSDMASRGILRSGLTDQRMADIGEAELEELANTQRDIEIQSEMMKQEAIRNALATGLGYSQLDTSRTGMGIDAMLSELAQLRQGRQWQGQLGLGYQQLGAQERMAQAELELQRALARRQQRSGILGLLGGAVGGLLGAPSTSILGGLLGLGTGNTGYGYSGTGDYFIG